MDGRRTRDAKEACGDVPPSWFLERQLLSWGEPWRGLREKLKEKAWTVVGVKRLLKKEKKGEWNSVLGVWERLIAEGCFGGWLEVGTAPTWLTSLKEAIGCRGGGDVEWVNEGDGSGPKWTEDLQDGERPREVCCDVRLNTMLRGKKSDEDGEDDGCFLEGRPGICTIKGLVRGLEESRKGLRMQGRRVR